MPGCIPILDMSHQVGRVGVLADHYLPPLALIASFPGCLLGVEICKTWLACISLENALILLDTCLVTVLDQLAPVGSRSLFVQN